MSENKSINYSNQKSIKLMSEEELLDFMETKVRDRGISSVSGLTSLLKTHGYEDDPEFLAAYHRYLQMSLPNSIQPLVSCTSSSETGKYLQEKYGNLKQETFVVLSLDTAYHIISEDKISTGTVDRALIPKAAVMRKLLENNAAAFIICHNHPSGRLLPSDADLNVTNTLAQLGDMLDIDLLDHFIVGTNDHFSLAEHEYI